MPDRVALLVGSYTYEQEPNLKGLRGPPNDIAALESVLGSPEIGGFAIERSINEPANRMLAQIEAFLADRQPDDVVLLYFSGIGIKDFDADGKLYLAATNTRLGELQSTALRASDINELLHRCRACHKLLILDCCQSGAFGRDALEAMRGIDSVGTRDAFADRGVAVLTGCDACQYAFASGRLQKNEQEVAQSYFTRALVEGLFTGSADRDGDGWVAFDELYEHIDEQVRMRTPGQVPHQWVLEQQGRLVVARVKIKPAKLPENLSTAFNDARREWLRKSAIDELLEWMGEDPNRALATRQALERLCKDDHEEVRGAARKALEQRTWTQRSGIPTFAAARVIKPALESAAAASVKPEAAAGPGKVAIEPVRASPAVSVTPLVPKPQIPAQPKVVPASTAPEQQAVSAPPRISESPPPSAQPKVVSDGAPKTPPAVARPAGDSAARTLSAVTRPATDSAPKAAKPGADSTAKKPPAIVPPAADTAPKAAPAGAKTAADSAAKMPTAVVQPAGDNTRKAPATRPPSQPQLASGHTAQQSLQPQSAVDGRVESDTAKRKESPKREPTAPAVPPAPTDEAAQSGRSSNRPDPKPSAAPAPAAHRDGLGDPVISKEQIESLAAAVRSATGPNLEVISGMRPGLIIPLIVGEGGVAEWTVGSHLDREVRLLELGVSASHAKLVNEGSRWKVVDQASASGTYVNGKRANVSFINSGDRLRFGPVECIFHQAQGAASAPAPPRSSGKNNRVRVITGIAVVVILAQAVLFTQRNRVGKAPLPPEVALVTTTPRAPARDVAMSPSAQTSAAPGEAGSSASINENGAEIYARACIGCHGEGLVGAPKVGDAARWAPRIAKGMAVLQEHSIQGFQGLDGYMPGRGGRIDISDQDVIDAVDYMVTRSK